MIVVICAVLAIGALLYAFWVKPEMAVTSTPADRELAFLNERKAVLYENLRDLHLEYRMGKLSEKDYQQLKEHYQAQLAALLHAFEQLHGPQPSKTQTAPGVCPHCGRQNAPEDRFCGGCGNQLAPRMDSSA